MKSDRVASAAKKSFASGREDGCFGDTAGFVHAFIKSRKPKLAFDPNMDAQQFPVWRKRLREKVLELMAFPEVLPQPSPECIKVEQRDGYQLQRWEAYPEPFCVVPFLMLVPDGTSALSPAPAVMCFPGYSGSKEGMAGEPELNERELNTEGGRTPHINRVRAAYRMQGAPDNVKVYYYKKYASAELRHYDDQPIPEGLTHEEYLLYANVDVADHRFHPERAVPWLSEVFAALPASSD